MAEARVRRRLTPAAATAVVALAAVLAGNALAQPLTRSPAWSELAPQEQQILAPIAPQWDKFDAQRKQKWRSIAQRYPTMTPDEQQHLHQQMRSWVQLTPEQRAAAREQYKSMNRLPAEQKQDVRQKWEQYQNAAPGDAARARVDTAAREGAGAGESGATRTDTRASAATRARGSATGPAQPGTGKPLTARAWTTSRRPARRRSTPLLRGGWPRSPTSSSCTRHSSWSSVSSRFHSFPRRRSGAPGLRVPDLPARVLSFALVFGAGAIYYVMSWTDGRRTLPMKTWRLRLVRADGRNVDLRTALIRYLAAWIGPALALGLYVALRPFGLGAHALWLVALNFLWALVDPARRFLHDRVAGTRLVRDSE